MAKHVKNEHARLLRKREQLIEQIATVNAKWAEEFRAVEAALKVYGASASSRYMQYRSTKDAIRACLLFENERMERYAIADKLRDGGFVMDPVLGRRLIAENINKNVSRGFFDVDSAGLIGVPEWQGQPPPPREASDI